MCLQILSGCDYLPSIQGLGLRTAHKLLRKYKTVEKVLLSLRMESTMKIPAGYINAFKMAELPFLHQRVYDPFEKKAVCWNDVPEGMAWTEEMDSYVGCCLDDQLARGIAEGDVHPTSKEPMPDIMPYYRPHKSKVRELFVP